MTSKPVVKDWMAPPTTKTTAPEKRVLRRPMISATRPAATDVTRFTSELTNWQENDGGVGLTEGADFEYGDHRANVIAVGLFEIRFELRASDNPRHNSTIPSTRVPAHPTTKTHPWSYPNYEPRPV